MASSLYAQLPQTAETQLAATMSDLQSEVRNAHEVVNAPSALRNSVLSVLSPVQSKYKEDGIRSLSQSFYSQLPETTETQLAKTVSELQSQVRTTPVTLSFRWFQAVTPNLTHLHISYVFINQIQMDTTHSLNWFRWLPAGTGVVETVC